jgi:hypothetical protein
MLAVLKVACAASCCAARMAEAAENLQATGAVLHKALGFNRSCGPYLLMLRCQVFFSVGQLKSLAPGAIMLSDDGRQGIRDGSC